MAELLPFLGFVFFGLFSPGPNVVLLASSGARFGFHRTLPHIAGVALGVGITAGITGLGLAALLTAQPVLTLLLKILSCGWILWMAARLWHADPATPDKAARPFTFVEAVLFQWVNPKVWAVAIAATAYLAGRAPVAQGLTMAAAFAGINLAVCLFWAAAGAVLSYLLTNPVAWRIFMRAMALALAGFALLVFL